MPKHKLIFKIFFNPNILKHLRQNYIELIFFIKICYFTKIVNIKLKFQIYFSNFLILLLNLRVTKIVIN